MSDDEVGVIAAKLIPHRRPRGVVSRPQLLDRLEDGKDAALTLVSAPAGFGKTTMLTDWVASVGPATPIAWVSLDARDTEPGRLWTHLIAALSGSRPMVGRGSMPALRAHRGQITDTVLPLLYDELSHDPDRIILILDDYHLAEHQEVDSQVAAFLRYRPAHVQVVISTRSDPALGVAALRAGGDLAEIRAEDLRFDAAEVAAFFDGVGVSDLTPSEVERLAERTGGWPAPIRLASLLIPEHDRGSFIVSFTGGQRQVVDYLTGDVLDVLPPDIRDFLLQVSVLGRLNGPLCDAVVAGSGSAERLADLERTNFFVSRDIESEWYHQHQLFAEALRLELTRTRPELVPLLHVRAATWLADAGDYETATDHAIAARDVGRAATLIARQVQLMAATGRWATIHGWLAALDWPEAVEHAELAFVRAVAAALDGRYDDALGFLRVARTGQGGDLDAQGLSLGFRIDFLECQVSVGEVTRAEATGRRAVATAPSQAWEGVALGGIGQSLYLQGRFDEAVAVLRRAVSQIPDANPIMLALAVGNLGLAEAAADEQPSRAGPMLDAVLQVLTSIGAGRTSAAAVLLLAIGERERRAGDLRRAIAHYLAATELLGVSPRGTWLALAHLLAAAAWRGLGDAAVASANVDAADEILDRVVDPGDLRVRSAHLRDLLLAPVRVASEYGEQLSDRELDVLRLAATGLEQRQIADQLFISYNTVKSHLKTSYRKLGVSSRAEAVERLRVLEPGAVSSRSPS